MVKVKRKDTNNKHLCSHEGTDDGVLGSIKVSEGDIASPTVFYDKASDPLSCTSMLGQSESSCCGIAVDNNKTECLFADEEEDSANLTARSNSAAVKEQVRDEVSGIMSNYSLDCGSVHNNVLLKDNMKTAATPDNSDVGTSPGSSMVDDNIDNYKKEQDVGLMEFSCMKGSLVIDVDLEGKVYSDSCFEKLQGPDVVAGSQSTEVLDHGKIDNRYVGDFGDWTSYWDSFYMRNYFYNLKTHESTWDPPPGMECLVFGEVIQQPEEMINEIAETDNLTVSFQDSKPLDSCGLQCWTDSFGESKNDYKSVDQPPSESSGGFEFTGDKFHDLMIVSTLNCDSKQLNETWEINKNCYDENPLHLLSKHVLNETQEIKHSLHLLSDDMDRYIAFFPILVL